MNKVLDTIRNHFEVAIPQLDLRRVRHIYASGSVARGEFYPGWSDVDIIVVGEPPLSFETISGLNRLCIELSAELNCKVGFDFISEHTLSALERVLNKHESLEGSLNFIKNYHEANREWLQAGTLFQTPGTDILQVSHRDFIDVPLNNYIEGLEQQVYETLMRRSKQPAIHLHELRIVTKATLYLLQTYVLAKEGALVARYTQVPGAARRYFPHDFAVLEHTYELLEKGDAQQLSEHYQETLRETFALFNALVRHTRDYS